MPTPMLKLLLLGAAAVGLATSQDPAPAQHDPALVPRDSSSTIILGRFIMDDVAFSCDVNQAHHITSAVKAAHLLIEPLLSGLPGDDPSFLSYFGDGYGGKYTEAFDDIFDNLRLAATVFPNSSVFSAELPPVARLRCVQKQSLCRTSQVQATTDPRSNPNVITFCPLAFSRIPNLHRGKFDPPDFPMNIHVDDITLDFDRHDVSNLATFRSHEHVLLHEVMHLRNMGYKIPSFMVGQGSGFIDDMSGDTPKGFGPLYGASNCKAYAGLKSGKSKPPNAAMQNADSYAWLASSKYWSQTLQLLITRDVDDALITRDVDDPPIGFNRTVVDPTQLDGSGVDPDKLFKDVDTVCSEARQAVAEDCRNIDVVSDSNTIHFNDHACFANGNRKWCNIYTSDSCQMAVGWDTTSSAGNDGPSMDNSQFAGFISGVDLSSTTCVNSFHAVDTVCPVGRTEPGLCTPPYIICVQEVGSGCEPGENLENLASSSPQQANPNGVPSPSADTLAIVAALP